MADSKRTLSLRLDALKPGEWLANTPPVVRYACDGESGERRARGAYQTTNAFWNQLQEVVVDGRPLLEAVSYERTSLWQFLPSYVWPEVFRAVELSEVVSALIDDRRPSEVECAPVADDTNELWLAVVSSIAAGRGICIRVGRAHSTLRHGGRAIVRRSDLGLVRERWRARRSRARLAHEWERVATIPQEAPSGRKLLWASRARDWVRQPGVDRYHDEHLYPLLTALKSAGWRQFVGVDCPYGDRALVATRFASRLEQHDDGVRWRPYFRSGDGSDEASRRARSVCGRIWRALEANPGFRDALAHRGVPLAPALANTFRRAFRFSLPDCAGQLAAAASILDEERPDAVMAVYENGPFARALIVEAGRRGIPSVGLQHGTIFSNHYDYMHRHVVPARQQRSGFAVPDLTCVWGAKWRDTLVRDGHYPADAVVVTGDWRYDDVKRRLAEVDVRALRRRLGVADGNAIAAILSSGQGTVDYVSAALDAVGSTPQLSPLIRLHPSDDPAPVRAELRRRRLPETVMPRVELLEILAASRIVISQWSTVIAEAALAGRDIMLVNLQGLPGAEAYIEAGICVPAVDSSGIRRGIDAILHDDPIQRQLAASRASFVRDYFFNADGRAAERVAEALDRLSA